MASQRQIDANRRNAAGPHQMTDAGKQAVRGNAIRHGLATKIHVVLPGEDQDFFNEILESIRAEYAPASTHEEMLVHQIVENYWRIIRARNMETGNLICAEQDCARMFKTESFPADDLERNAQLGVAYSRCGKLFEKLNRYEATAERSYYRAIRELNKVQQNRQKREAVAGKPVADELQPETAPEIRSVPQNPPSPPNPVPQIGSDRQNPPSCTALDIHTARIKMSDAEFDEFLEEITAPPAL